MLAVDVRTYRPSKAGEEYKAFDASVVEIGTLLEGRPGDLLEWDERFGRLEWAAIALVSRVKALTGIGPNVMDRWEVYVRRFEMLVRERRVELESTAPWIAPLQSAEGDKAGLAVSRERSEAFDSAWQAIRLMMITPGSPVAMAGVAERLPTALRNLESSGSRRASRTTRPFSRSMRSPRRPRPRSPPGSESVASGWPSAPTSSATAWTSSSSTRTTGTCSRSART